MNELVSTDLSLVELVWNASFLVQLVMLVLLVASFASWTMVFLKRSYINRERSAAETFEEQFWSGQDLVALYNRINSPQYEPLGLERIFHSGFREFAKLRNQKGLEPRLVLEGTQRAMRVR